MHLQKINESGALVSDSMASRSRVYKIDLMGRIRERRAFRRGVYNPGSTKLLLLGLAWPQWKLERKKPCVRSMEQALRRENQSLCSNVCLNRSDYIWFYRGCSSQDPKNMSCRDFGSELHRLKGSVTFS